MTTRDILEIEFKSLMDDIVSLYDSKGMRASGNFADTLEINSSTNNAKLIGDNYAEQLDYGRKKGKFPPIEMIKQWILNKNIMNKVKGNISISSLAFLIARKISKEGWKREGYGGVNLISEVVTAQRMQSIINKVGAELTLSLVTKLGNELKLMKV